MGCYLVSTSVYVLLSLGSSKQLLSCMLCCPVCFAVYLLCCTQLCNVNCAIHAACNYIGAQCRLWTTKQEQEKVLDEEATKRKQDAADAKVRCITHPQSQLTFIGHLINCLDDATYGNQDAANTMVRCVAGSLLVSHTQATLTSHDD